MTQTDVAATIDAGRARLIARFTPVSGEDTDGLRRATCSSPKTIQVVIGGFARGKCFMSVDSNKAVVHKAFQAWNTGDDEFARWAQEAVAPAISVQVPVVSMEGLEGYLAYYRTVREAFPDAHATVDEMVGEGDRVIVLYTFTGTNTGMLLSRPVVTGKHATFTVVEVYRFADGKIVGLWQTYDRLALFEQLDALAAAAEPILVPA